MFRTATWFEYETEDGLVRLNLQHSDLDAHLRGFRGYVAQLPDGGEATAEAHARISRTKTCLGVYLPGPVSPESDAFASLVKIIDRFGGFMFVADSIMLPDGRFLVGPMAGSVDEREGSPEPEVREVDPEECRHKGATEGVNPERVAMRERNS